MSGRRFFSSTPFDSSRSATGTRAAGQSAGPFSFSIPIDSINNFTQNIINSPTIANLMSGSRSSPFGANGAASDSQDACESCQAKFTLLKRRKTCCECEFDFCSNCFSSPDLTELRPSRRTCRRCRILSARPLDRMLLMTLRVRDLRWYLQKQHVSVNHCKEKSELVDLVLHRNGYRVPSYGAGVAPVSSYRTSRHTDSPHHGSRTSSTPQNRSSSSLTDEWIFVNDDDAAEAQAPVQPADASAKEAPESCDSDFKALSIDSVESEDQIRQLSARQLKVLLARNFVDFKGCCERDELMQKVLRLWREKKEAQKVSLEDIADENLCKICMEKVIDCVLLECGHMISCVACGKRLSECPICRQYVVRAVRIFKS